MRLMACAEQYELGRARHLARARKPQLAEYCTVAEDLVVGRMRVSGRRVG